MIISFTDYSGKRVLCRISHPCRLIVANLLYINADVFEYLIERLAEVSEHYSTMMREILFYQHVTVETAHLIYGKYSDTSK